MAIIESSIQPFIDNQFPALYRDDDPNYISFVKAYYQWLEETGKPLYYARNFLELQDVDKTTENVLVFIKEKYLKNIRFSTEANIRAIIKHSLDIYRSKGTQRCIDLLFRLVFNEVIEIYYPKVDILRLSDGTWRIPQYLELSLSVSNANLRHKTIRGADSGAIAFVDDVIRRTVKTRFIDLAYISAIEGQFITGEIIHPTDGEMEIALCPRIIGSLNEIVLPAIGTGTGYTNGDIVTIHSDYGEQAQALVINASEQPSIIAAIVNNGGYGYTTNAEILVSERSLSLANVDITNTYARSYLNFLDTVTQGGNTAQAMGIDNITIYIDAVNGTFIVGETIIQHNRNYVNDKSIIGQATLTKIPTSTILWFDDVKGVFYPNTQIIGLTSKATANVISVNMTLAIINSTGTFSNTSLTMPSLTADVIYVGANTQPIYSIPSSTTYQENVLVNTDLLSDWTVPLNSATYPNFPANTSANSGTSFDNFLSMNAITIGKITELLPQSSVYLTDYLPMVTISEARVKDLNIWDKVLFYTGASATFKVGEIVTQSATSARGIVQKNANNKLYIQELRFNSNNWFIVTSNTTTKILGATTGATANVTIISDQGDIRPTGLNAVIDTEAPTAIGSVLELQIINSGFGYIDNELIWFNIGDTFDENNGYGYTNLVTRGIGPGFYEQKGGFLSDQKKLYDGYYYQNFSYEISSSKTVDKYRDMMKKIGHVAGTKMFSRYVHKRTLDSSSLRKEIEVTQT